jgi:CheY-like chemotaxis protein
MLTDLRKKYDSELKHRTKNDLELILDMPSEYEEPVITTDGNKLISILESLLENAIGFSSEGIINFGYTIVQGREIHFFFHDTGAGISMDQLETAFKAYISNPSGMDISYDLAALRMEVARRFTEVLEGKIWSNSKLGAGSSFYLSLSADQEIQSVKKEEPLDSHRPDWKNSKILIAEDIDSNYMLLKTLLSVTNLEIVRAKNGTEAVHIFENSSNGFDAILMDIVMPDMDGFEAALRIKKVNKTIPIIGQTAYCLDSEDESGKLKHFDDFLTKPIWSHELIRTLGKYLS